MAAIQGWPLSEVPLYQNLARNSISMFFLRRSVDVIEKQATCTSEGACSTASPQENTDSIQRITEGYPESAENTDSIQKITEGYPESAENTDSIQRITEEYPESAEKTVSIQSCDDPKSMYVFVTVDRFGDNKENCEPLEVKGQL